MSIDQPTVTCPIIVDEHGSLSFFRSLTDAELGLEAVDVLNQEYAAYDASGRKLRLEVHSREERSLFGLVAGSIDLVKIVVADREPSDGPNLRALLSEYLTTLGEEVAASSQLADLIALALTRTGYS